MSIHMRHSIWSEELVTKSVNTGLGTGCGDEAEGEEGGGPEVGHAGELEAVAWPASVDPHGPPVARSIM